MVSALSALHAEVQSHLDPPSSTIAPRDMTAHRSPPPTGSSKATYSWSWLLHYDVWVLWIVNTFAWGCSTARYLLPQFRANVGRTHLELGVGTGYYLVRGGVPASTCLTLVDRDPRALNTAVKRTKRRDATTIVADVLEPLDLPEKYDSISMYYLLDGLRASVQEKCNLFGRLRLHMTASGVLHGATILGKGVRDDNRFARYIRNGCVTKGIFRNQEDNAYDFEQALRENFKEVETRVIGTVFLFHAMGLKSGDLSRQSSSMALNKETALA